MTEPSRQGIGLAEAQRILSDPAYVQQLIQEAIDQLGKATLDDGELTMDRLLDRRGVVKGLRIANSFYVQARQILAAAQEEAEAAQAGLSSDTAPPGLVAATVRPIPGEGV